MENEKEFNALLEQGKQALERLRAIEILAGENREDIKRLTKAIFVDNGQKGLKFQFEDLREEVTEIKEREAERKKDQKNLRYTAYGVLIVLILNFLWKLLPFNHDINQQNVQSQQVQQQLIDQQEKIIDKKFEELLKRLEEHTNSEAKR